MRRGSWPLPATTTPWRPRFSGWPKITHMRQEMGRRGCRCAKEVFSEEQMHAAYEKIYEEITGA